MVAEGMLNDAEVRDLPGVVDVTAYLWIVGIESALARMFGSEAGDKMKLERCLLVWRFVDVLVECSFALKLRLVDATNWHCLKIHWVSELSSKEVVKDEHILTPYDLNLLKLSAAFQSFD